MIAEALKLNTLPMRCVPTEKLHTGVPRAGAGRSGDVERCDIANIHYGAAARHNRPGVASALPSMVNFGLKPTAIVRDACQLAIGRCWTHAPVCAVPGQLARRRFANPGPVARSWHRKAA